MSLAGWVTIFAEFEGAMDLKMWGWTDLNASDQQTQQDRRLGNDVLSVTNLGYVADHPRHFAINKGTMGAVQWL